MGYETYIGHSIFVDDLNGSKRAVQFRDMCSECSQEELISLCLKIIYHLRKEKTIVSFKFKYPFESGCECRQTSNFARPDILLPSLHKQQSVFTCRGITVLTRDSDGNVTSFVQPPLSLGQGFATAENQYHARVFNGDPKQGPVQFVGLFIGFRLQALDFCRNIMDGEYKYAAGPDEGPLQSRIFSLKSGATSSSREVYEDVRGCVIIDRNPSRYLSNNC